MIEKEFQVIVTAEVKEFATYRISQELLIIDVFIELTVIAESADGKNTLSPF